MEGLFSNTLKIVSFKLKRERIVSTIWIVSLVFFSFILAAGFPEMFDDSARQALAETLKNPAMVAMMGTVYGSDNFTVGAMYSALMFIWVAMAVGAMNIFLVVRHTRADEDTERSDVIRSLPTGRLSILNATMVTSFIVNLILAALTGLSIALIGEESMPLGASLLYGIGLGLTGLFFAAVAGLFAQLSSNSRGAISYSFIAMAVFYLMRAAGDMDSNVLSLISPLGLIQSSEFFVENYILPSIILLGITAVIFIAALKLNSIRDLGQGFIAARHGKPHGGVLMNSCFGFSFKMVRNTIIAWIVILICLGASYGSILPDIDTFINQSPFYQQIIGANDKYSNLEMFVSTINIIGALFATVPVIIIALKPFLEERNNRTEIVLATPVSRENYIFGYTFCAFVASIILLLANVLGLYAASAAFLDQPLSLDFLLKANIVFFPALWVMIGVTCLLGAFSSRITSAIWAYYGFSFFILFMGRMLSIPDWLSFISPFGHIPLLPTDSISTTPLLALAAISIGLFLGGILVYEQRDIG